MKSHFTEKPIGNYRRQFVHMNNSYLTADSNHQQQYRNVKAEACNQRRPLSQKDSDELLIPKNNIRSSSSASFSNLGLKEYNLTRKDLDELRQALRTIFDYLKSKVFHDDKRRLVSPYVLQQTLSDDDHSSLPLYTDEYFIRNGLLNHNDGPEIQDHQRPLKILCCSDHLKVLSPLENYSSSSSTKLTSSINISVPLALFSNRNHCFTALTSNFAFEKIHPSKSNLELCFNKYDEHDETKSMTVRRRKVQTWERENSLQRPILSKHDSVNQEDQVDGFKCQHDSVVQLPSAKLKEKTMENFITKKYTSVRITKDATNYDAKYSDDLFPMVKVLAPYIIIRDSWPQMTVRAGFNDVRTANVNKLRKDDHRLIKLGEKRSVTHLLESTSINSKKRS